MGLIALRSRSSPAYQTAAAQALSRWKPRKGPLGGNRHALVVWHDRGGTQNIPVYVPQLGSSRKASAADTCALAADQPLSLSVIGTLAAE